MNNSISHLYLLIADLRGFVSGVSDPMADASRLP